MREGICVVTTRWIDASLEAGWCQDEAPFVLQDDSSAAREGGGQTEDGAAGALLPPAAGGADPTAAAQGALPTAALLDDATMLSAELAPAGSGGWASAAAVEPSAAAPTAAAAAAPARGPSRLQRGTRAADVAAVQAADEAAAAEEEREGGAVVPGGAGLQAAAARAPTQEELDEQLEWDDGTPTFLDAVRLKLLGCTQPEIREALGLVRWYSGILCAAVLGVLPVCCAAYTCGALDSFLCCTQLEMGKALGLVRPSLLCVVLCSRVACLALYVHSGLLPCCCLVCTLAALKTPDMCARFGFRLAALSLMRLLLLHAHARSQLVTECPPAPPLLASRPASRPQVRQAAAKRFADWRDDLNHLVVGACLCWWLGAAWPGVGLSSGCCGCCSSLVNLHVPMDLLLSASLVSPVLARSGFQGLRFRRPRLPLPPAFR